MSGHFRRIQAAARGWLQTLLGTPCWVTSEATWDRPAPNGDGHSWFSVWLLCLGTSALGVGFRRWVLPSLRGCVVPSCMCGCSGTIAIRPESVVRETGVKGPNVEFVRSTQAPEFVRDDREPARHPKALGSPGPQSHPFCFERGLK